MRDALATTTRRLTSYADEAAGLAALGAKDLTPRDMKQLREKWYASLRSDK